MFSACSLVQLVIYPAIHSPTHLSFNSFTIVSTCCVLFPIFFNFCPFFKLFIYLSRSLVHSFLSLRHSPVCQSPHFSVCPLKHPFIHSSCNPSLPGPRTWLNSLAPFTGVFFHLFRQKRDSVSQWISCILYKTKYQNPVNDVEALNNAPSTAAINFQIRAVLRTLS